MVSKYTLCIKYFTTSCFKNIFNLLFKKIPLNYCKQQFLNITMFIAFVTHRRNFKTRQVFHGHPLLIYRSYYKTAWRIDKVSATLAQLFKNAFLLSRHLSKFIQANFEHTPNRIRSKLGWTANSRQYLGELIYHDRVANFMVGCYSRYFTDFNMNMTDILAFLLNGIFLFINCEFK